VGEEGLDRVVVKTEQGETDRQTDGQTDRQTDRQTEMIIAS
jgi:hypothetical protein